MHDTEDKSLTNAAEKEDYEERACHRDDGPDKVVEDSSGRSEAAHRTKNSAASKHQYEAQRKADGRQADEGGAHHK